MNGLIEANRFLQLLESGGIHKDILPNHALDYSEHEEKRELESYKRFLQTSSFDFLNEIKKIEYKGADWVEL